MTSAAERIISAADQLFFSLGFSRVSMDELASSLGMSKKTIYKYFPNKEALLLAVIESFSLEINNGINIILSGDGGFLQKLEDFIDYIASKMNKIQNPHLASLQHASPPVWAHIQLLREKTIQEKFGALLEIGRKEGLIRDDVNLQLVQIMIWGALEKLVIPEFIAKLPMTADEILAMMTDILLNGINRDAPL